ncbi:MAG TPA: DUF72 domain-containing protein [Gemmatimonadales bacterium]|nr:DUF72 domain-containing protein [Gemmatimonadales bacterium]
MRVAVGTSGYAYKEWKGTFYPEKLPQDQMLRYYGEQFPTVEINNTFYRMPSEKVVLNWASQVPDTFQFVLKASQRITHQKRLQDVGEELGYFLKTSSVLGARLGPTLFQLPPNFKKDVARLEAFLALLPYRWRAAVEFRHASWYDDEVFTALRNRGVALCAADTDEAEALVEPTADWGYLRLRGEQYQEADLKRWAQRVLAQPWQEAFVFFKHEDAGTGPAFARQFMQALGRGETP